MCYAHGAPVYLGNERRADATDAVIRSTGVFGRGVRDVRHGNVRAALQARLSQLRLPPPLLRSLGAAQRHRLPAGTSRLISPANSSWISMQAGVSTVPNSVTWTRLALVGKAGSRGDEDGRRRVRLGGRGRPLKSRKQLLRRGTTGRVSACTVLLGPPPERGPAQSAPLRAHLHRHICDPQRGASSGGGAGEPGIQSQPSERLPVGP